MGFGNVAVIFGYTLLYEAQLVFVILVASAVLLLSGTMELLCGFYSLTTTDVNFKYEIIQAVSVRKINQGRGS
jgi:hypothetical protein